MSEIVLADPPSGSLTWISSLGVWEPVWKALVGDCILSMVYVPLINVFPLSKLLFLVWGEYMNPENL